MDRFIAPGECLLTFSHTELTQQTLPSGGYDVRAFCVILMTWSEIANRPVDEPCESCGTKRAVYDVNRRNRLFPLSFSFSSWFVTDGGASSGSRERRRRKPLERNTSPQRSEENRWTASLLFKPAPGPPRCQIAHLRKVSHSGKERKQESEPERNDSSFVATIQSKATRASQFSSSSIWAPNLKCFV